MKKSLAQDLDTLDDDFDWAIFLLGFEALSLAIAIRLDPNTLPMAVVALVIRRRVDDGVLK